MKNIVLCCAAGMSTSMLVQRMKDAAQKKGVEVTSKAVAVAEFKDNIATADIVLLGPQVKYEQAKLQAQADPLGKKVAVIDMMDYGMMKGDAVLEKANFWSHNGRLRNHDHGTAGQRRRGAQRGSDGVADGAKRRL